MQTQAFKPKKVLRYPRLDTILMVEEFIQKHSGEHTKTQLWEKLPRKTMYQTFCTILDYLEYSNKIITDKEKKIVWIWDPEGVKKLLSEGLIVK
ncbi:hypothetical protein K8R43_02815 [archaeon]|nr:hypothetical protein [archaeon]